MMFEHHKDKDSDHLLRIEGREETTWLDLAYWKKNHEERGLVEIYMDKHQLAKLSHTRDPRTLRL